MDAWSPEEIKALRASLNLTQVAFGELVGVTRIYVNYLEKGVKRPSKTLKILLGFIKDQHNKKEKEDDNIAKKTKRR